MEQFVERVATLRDEFYTALEHGDISTARRNLEGLASLTPEDAGLDSMRSRLAALEENRSRPEPPPEPAAERPAAVAPQLPSPPDSTKVKDLLQKADEHYQREQYGDALAALEAVLADDPANDEALRLQELVERSKDLSEKVAEEDAKMHERTSLPAAPRSAGEPVAQDIPDAFAGSVEQQGPMAPPRPPLSSRARPVLKSLALVLLVLAVAIGGYVIVRKLKATVAPTQVAVLVLPSTTSTGDPQADQLIAGFRDDVLLRLAAIADSRIVAPAAAARPAAFSAVQTARTAGTNMLLRWNVSGNASALSIDAVLLDTAGSTVQWNKQYSVNTVDLAATRPEILKDLVGALGVHTTDEEGSVLSAPPTTNGGAYLTYLRGRGLLEQPGTSPALAAVQLFESALQADPSFTEARAALGWAHILAWESGDTATAHVTGALTACQRVLVGGVRNSEAWRTHGSAEQIRGRYDSAIDDFGEALTIAPSDPESRRRLAYALIVHGQPDKALAAAQRAVRDDPANPASYTTLGLIQQFVATLGGDNRDEHLAALRTFKIGERLSADPGTYASRYLANVHLYAQQPDEAESILTNDIAQDPENFESLYRLGRVQQAAGRPISNWQTALVGARKAIEKRLAAAPDDPVLLSWLALVQTRLGAFKEAQTAFNRALNARNTNATVLYNVARVHALQQDLKVSAEFLQKAVQRNYDLVAVLDMDLFNLHGDPDFQRSVTR